MVSIELPIHEYFLRAPKVQPRQVCAEIARLQGGRHMHALPPLSLDPFLCQDPEAHRRSVREVKPPDRLHDAGLCEMLTPCCANIYRTITNSIPLQPYSPYV